MKNYIFGLMLFALFSCSLPISSDNKKTNEASGQESDFFEDVSQLKSSKWQGKNGSTTYTVEFSVAGESSIIIESGSSKEVANQSPSATLNKNVLTVTAYLRNNTGSGLGAQRTATLTFTSPTTATGSIKTHTTVSGIQMTKIN